MIWVISFNKSGMISKYAVGRGLAPAGSEKYRIRIGFRRIRKIVPTAGASPRPTVSFSPVIFKPIDLYTFAEPAGGHAGDAAEHIVEGADILVAALGRDVGNGCIGAQQQLGGLADADTV